jgi:Zn-dependent membrane protease YugP
LIRSAVNNASKRALAMLSSSGLVDLTELQETREILSAGGADL